MPLGTWFRYTTPQLLIFTGLLAEDADYSDGGLGCNRTLREEHPFHMHGHHFWVLGHGLGVYNETANRTSLNVVNPPYRDSFTIFKNGWSVIRFKVCLRATIYCSIPAQTRRSCVFAGHLR